MPSAVAGELLSGYFRVRLRKTQSLRVGPGRFRTPLAGVAPSRAGSSLAGRCAVAVAVPLAVGGDARAAGGEVAGGGSRRGGDEG